MGYGLTPPIALALAMATAAVRSTDVISAGTALGIVAVLVLAAHGWFGCV